MTEMKQTILRFEAVDYRAVSEASASVSGISLALAPGALAAVHVDHDSEQVPIADLASGLLVPSAGRILFEEQDWQSMDPFEQAAARGRIGCVLEQPGWVASLGVLQNIMLRERHHTRRPDAEIADEAGRLCQLAGLDAIPAVRPDRVRSRELRMLEFVRAFMGTPALVVLAFPEREALSDACAVCAQLAGRARAAGTAVIWISDDAEVWRQPLMESAEHFQIKNERWMPLNRKDI
jgi:phospholipid/cholesterol/gamma-HCH transport system ATP-binding protein